MKFSEEEIHAAQAAHKDRLYLTKFLDTDSGIICMFDLMHVDTDRATKDHWKAAHAIRDSLVSALVNATSIAVPEQMCELVHAQSPTYPETRVDSGDMLFPYGFAWFDRAVPDPYNPHDALPLRAMLWWTQPASEIPGMEGDHYVMTLIGMCDTKTLPGVTPTILSSTPRVLPCVSTIWELDADDGGSLAHGIEDGDPRRSYVRTLLTLWAVVRQRMADAEPVGNVLRRPYAHYARKSGYNINESLRIVRLSPTHAPKASYVGANRPEWSVRWWVRAHWRKHWFAASGRHKPKLILPYPKGDPDKPVKGQERIYLPPKEK